MGVHLDLIRVKSETMGICGARVKVPFSILPKVIPFQIRQTYRVTVHGHFAAVTGLPCVFYIVSHFADFVKNFFRLPRKWYFLRYSRLSTIPAYLVTLPVVTGRSVLTVRTLYHTFRHLSRRNFSTLSVLLHMVRASGLRFARPVYGDLLPVPVSATSARVPLCALHVGVMALRICPGFPGLTSIGSPVWIVFGCKGTEVSGSGCPLPL